MSGAKASKLVQAVVDRVVNDVVVALIRHPDAAEDEPDTFKEIYIPGERFKDFPNEGDIIPIDPDKPDVITVNIGNTLYCEVVFFMAHAENEYRIFKYEEKHTMSGLYNDADDINAILAARRKFWKAANDDKFSLERKNPDKHVYFSKSTYWTNKCQDKELFTAFVRQIAFKGYANNIQFEAVKNSAQTESQTSSDVKLKLLWYKFARIAKKFNGGYMKKLFLVVLLLAFHGICFANPDQRIELYNEYFVKKDFQSALLVVESLIASFPQTLDYYREKAKLLAATDLHEDFFQTMQFIREHDSNKELTTFFSVLTHDMVTNELRTELRRRHFQKNDTQVLINWPSFKDENIVDCRNLNVGKSENLNFSSNYSSSKGLNSQLASQEEPHASNESGQVQSNLETRPNYGTMAIEDLKVDIDSLVGKKVKVAGFINYSMDVCSLRESEKDWNPIGVEVKNLSREQKKALFQIGARGSWKTVYGVVIDLGYKKEILADSIE